jgi:hypothetical protein
LFSTIINMATALPYPFPYTPELQGLMDASQNFIGAFSSLRTAKDAELAQLADSGEMAPMMEWLERAAALKVSGHKIASRSR